MLFTHSTWAWSNQHNVFRHFDECWRQSFYFDKFLMSFFRIAVLCYIACVTIRKLAALIITINIPGLSRACRTDVLLFVLTLKVAIIIGTPRPNDDKPIILEAAPIIRNELVFRARIFFETRKTHAKTREYLNFNFNFTFHQSYL